MVMVTGGVVTTVVVTVTALYSTSVAVSTTVVNWLMVSAMVVTTLDTKSIVVMVGWIVTTSEIYVDTGDAVTVTVVVV